MNLSENRIIVLSEGESLRVVFCLDKEEISVVFNRKTKKFESFSGEGERKSKFRGKIDEVDIGEDEIRLECYIDHSMIELYLNHKKSMTFRNYSQTGKRSMTVESNGECKVYVWTLK